MRGLICLHRLVVEAEPLDDAGPEILDQHVGLGEQPRQRLEVGRILQVDGKAFLVAVDGVEDGRVAADLGVAEIEPPRQVAAIRPLDLDDAGAEIEQPQRRSTAPTGTGSCRRRRGRQAAVRPLSVMSLLLGLADEVGRVLVFHRLQMLAIEHQLALALEHFVAGADQPHLLVARAFCRGWCGSSRSCRR